MPGKIGYIVDGENYLDIFKKLFSFKTKFIQMYTTIYSEAMYVLREYIVMRGCAIS